MIKAEAITKVVIETYRRETITTASPAMIRFCLVCGRDTLFSPVTVTVSRFGITLRRLFRLIESGALHCIESGHDRVWICDASAESEFARTRISGD